MTEEFDGMYLIKNSQTRAYLKSIEHGQLSFTPSYFMARKYGTEEMARSVVDHLTSFSWTGLPLVVCKATISVEEIK